VKRNVLVFPCGSEIGLEIFRSMNLSTHFELWGGSSVDDHGKFVYKNYIGNIPDVGDQSFLQKIKEIVKKYNIDFIFPAHDSVILKLAKEKAAGKLDCDVITSPLSTCEIARSKKKTYDFFTNIIPTPKIYQKSDLSENDLPVFLKPDVGQGSKGVHLANTMEEVEFYCKNNPSLLLLEFLPGKEYTVDCFSNKDGKLLFVQGRVRNRVLNGISVNTSSVKDDRFAELAEKINNKLQLRGVWFFQVKENRMKDLVLLEIASRVAGTMGLVRAEGVNLVLASIFDAMGYEVDIFKNNYDMVIDRALENKFKHDLEYGHVYLDLDDLVIYEDKVNPAVMAFVYQCINKGVVLHLITKHRQVLSETLEKHRLTGVFDELIPVNGQQEKSDYIKERDSIFIDDSFSERKKIHEAHGIPVFDSHMLESLMEKF